MKSFLSWLLHHPEMSEMWSETRIPVPEAYSIRADPDSVLLDPKSLFGIETSFSDSVVWSIFARCWCTASILLAHFVFSLWAAKVQIPAGTQLQGFSISISSDTNRSGPDSCVEDRTLFHQMCLEVTLMLHCDVTALLCAGNSNYRLTVFLSHVFSVSDH